jgi:hypothetical protein
LFKSTSTSLFKGILFIKIWTIFIHLFAAATLNCLHFISFHYWRKVCWFACGGSVILLKVTIKRPQSELILLKFYFVCLQDIDWVQTEKHVFETATNYPFLVGLHSCFQTDSRYVIDSHCNRNVLGHLAKGPSELLV